MNKSLNICAFVLWAGLASSAFAGGCCESGTAGQATAHPASWNGSEKSWGAKADIVDTAVAAGSFNTLAAALTLSSAKTLQGTTVDISTKSGVKVDNAKVVKTDINATNGVIHVIDAVILPN